MSVGLTVSVTVGCGGAGGGASTFAVTGFLAHPARNTSAAARVRTKTNNDVRDFINLLKFLRSFGLLGNLNVGSIKGNFELLNNAKQNSTRCEQSLTASVNQSSMSLAGMAMAKVLREEMPPLAPANGKAMPSVARAAHLPAHAPR